MNWSYVAGVFDGEGCGNIYYIKQGYPRGGYWRPKIFITNKNERLLDSIIEFLAQKGISARRYSNRVHIEGWSNVIRFLGGIYNLIIVKKESAYLLFRACQIYTKYRATKSSRPDKELSRISVNISRLSRKGPRHPRITLP